MASDPLQLYFLLLAAGAIAVWSCLLLPPLARSSSSGSSTVPLAALYVVGIGRVVLVAVDPKFEHSGTDISSGLHDRVSQLTYLASFALVAAALVGSLTSAGKSVRVWVLCLVGFGLIGGLSAAVNSGGFDIRSLAFPGLVFVIARGRNMNLSIVTVHLRYILRFTTLGSLALLLWSPDSAVMPLQGRSIFGIDQLAGLSTHPNALGATAALGLVVEFARPRSRWWILWVAGDATCLVLAQSRGGWMAALAVALTMTAAKLGRTHTILFACILGLAVSWLLLSESVFTTGLNGRDMVWRVAFDVFVQNPLLGGGPDVLLREVDAGRLPAFAAQAHNQLLDALAKRGLVGGALVVGFFVSALRRADRIARQGNPAPLAALIALLTWSIVETVLGPTIVCLGCVALLAANVGRGSDEATAEPHLINHAA